MKTNCGTFWGLMALSCCAALFLAAASGETVPKPRTQIYDEAYWFDPAHDLTLSIVVPRSEQQTKRQANATANETTTYRAADFGCTDDAVAYCRQQGGQVSYQQYAYVSGASVMAFGRKRAFCNLGTYTLTELETMSSPYVTLAQMAYLYPIADFEWDRTQWGNPATQYCVQSKGATVSTMYVEAASSCTGTGWSSLPAESSPGLSNTCEFADGSSIDAWALFNGQTKSSAARIPFRTQITGQACM